jgi:hypothetical protein
MMNGGHEWRIDFISDYGLHMFMFIKILLVKK